MAISNDNILTRFTSGGLGKQVVFRQRGGKTIMAKWPSVDPNRKPTTGQSAAQREFQLAVMFGQFARKDETLIARYKKLTRGTKSVYHAAISDAKMPPELSEPRLAAYTGQPGQELIIQAEDNYKVERVLCSIITRDGEILESGEAVQQENEFDWTYTTQKENPQLEGTRIRFAAFDIPKNETEFVITL